MKEIEKGWVQGRSLRCSFDIASRGGRQWTHTINSVTTQTVPTGDRVGWVISVSIVRRSSGTAVVAVGGPAATTGTPFYRLRTATDVVTVGLTLLCHGCPLQAAAFGFDERTVAQWQARAGEHCQEVHQHLVEQGQVELGQVQADELWVKLVGKCVWMAMALAVPARLGLGGVISAHRDRALITELVQKVLACARSLAILVCVDGLASYVTAFLRVFRDPVHTGRRGRPRLVVESGLLIGQVIKRYARRRVVKVVHR